MSGQEQTGLARRERVGSQKRAIGVKNMLRMLPGNPNAMHGGEIPPTAWSGDMSLMSLEDSYCDMWDRTDVIDSRTRSLFNVSLMVGVGNVSNGFELTHHAPGAVYNGATIEELEALIVHARIYVGSPAAAWASQMIQAALKDHDLMRAIPPADLERKEKTGSEKRTIAKRVLAEIEPDSPLLELSDDEMPDTFAAELDYMLLESVYFDLWARTHVLDHRTRSIITLGLIMGLGNHDALQEHVPVALRNGVTVPELEELVYQAATYLGFMSGKSIRTTIAATLTEPSTTA